MKTNLTLLFFLIQMTILAQVKIVALHHPGSDPQFFSNEANAEPFQLAYTAAVDGDTIYIPGGTFAPPASFNKRIAIYGAGHFPSATTVTQTTKISGNFNLGDMADGSHLEGLLFQGSIVYPNESVNDLIIKRCYITSNITASSTSGNYCLDNYFFENVIQGEIDFNNLRSYLFENNFIRGSSRNLVMGMFSHNIFLKKSEHYGTGDWVIFYANSSTFNDNIFICTTGYYSQQNLLNSGTCTWNNNAFAMSSPTLGVDPIVSGNHYNQIMSNLFVNYVYDTPFSYSYDYHLSTLGLGLSSFDTTQLGVYGGTNPFKDESIPVNPHIQSATIQQNSNNGLLNVNIQVQAQSR
jgi:hypothetical protein